MFKRLPDTIKAEIFAKSGDCVIWELMLDIRRGLDNQPSHHKGSTALLSDSARGSVGFMTVR